ncbi:MAG: hybrid sensor histidine kinase/response regulator, partial [Sphingobacteriales bacterium]
FTVSVNRALMVTLGKDTYAIPLNAIEGIVRVSPFELEHYYQQPDARFEYADENYQVRYLGGMLYEGTSPKLEGQLLPLPVILVRSAQHTMALQVDGLQGSREIVVKSLGKQFAAVQGLSGATVMGDGSVVVILDVHALVRKAVAFVDALPLTHERTKALNAPRVQKTVMVVDDSVTVRKVTTRFLEREGYLVITAKDGVDALKILQDHTPDLMLLDIEMPRMDGFEVAKNIRTTARWKHIPIVMITSRTGDKHREHALSIGVNEYLGKPYQEDVLAGIVGRILGDKGA